MPLPAVRAFVVSQLEPPLTWRYGPELRLWPFLSSCVAAIIASFIFLVVTNYNSQSCQDALQFDNWRETAAARCRLLEDATGDWTLLMQQWPPRLASANLFVAPKVVALPEPPEQRPFAPYDCDADSMLPTGFRFLVQISDVSAGIWYVSVLARLQFDPPLIVVMRGFVPDEYYRLMADGGIIVSVSNFSTNSSQWRPVIVNSTFASPGTANLVLLMYGRVVPSQLHLMLVAACGNFVLSKHLMECRTCTQDSWVTIGWLIVLGCVQAVTLIYSITRCCLHSHNRRHQIGTRDSSAAEPMLSDEQERQWSQQAT